MNDLRSSEINIGALMVTNEDGETFDDSELVMEDVGKRCFLCNHSAETEIMYHLFEERPREDGQTECSLAVIISSALGRGLDETQVHSTLLCAPCYETALEYESLEQRFWETRLRILSSYNCTAMHNNLAQIELLGDISDAHDIEAEPDANDASIAQNQPIDVEHTEVQEPNNVALVVADEANDSSDKYTYPITNSTLNKFTLPEDDDLSIDIVGDDIVIYNDNNLRETSEENHSMDLLSSLRREQCRPLIDETDIEVKEDVYVQDHPSLIRNGKTLFCKSCDNSKWYNRKSFEEHIRVDHTSRLGVCELCDETFATTDELNAHHEECHTEMKFQCDLCSKPFANYNALRAHKRKHNPNSRQFECNVCHKRYISKNVLTEHMNIHTGSRPYKCNQCPKAFASKYTLHTHVKIHSDRQRAFKCDECDKTFLKSQTLFQHRKLHTGAKNFNCDVCLKGFSTQHNLDVHKIVHSGLRPFICKTCGKSFARRGDIRDHERIHTGERPFKCDICDLAFTQRSNLMSHKKSTHMNEKLHKCTECERMFKRRRLLDYHMQASHTGERPHKCEICGASFVYPDHFKKHMIIHTGKKPYACEVCDKTFNSRENRNAHRFVHSDKKPYECLDCGTSFMRKPLLLAHIKRYKHSNHTIIVNQPQISGETAKSTSPSIGSIEQGELNEEYSLDSMIESEDTILVDMKLDEQCDVLEDDDMEYMEFHDINEENVQETFTWGNSSDNQ